MRPKEEDSGPLGNQVKDLQNEFRAWDDRASDFLVHPRLAMPPIADGDMSFLHYMNVLRDIRNAGKVTALQ